MIQLLGAAAFGAIIGWYVYYINRYRKGDVQFSDLTTVIGIIGGAGITQLFGGGDKELFGVYGIGLFLGFFGYFSTLIYLVKRSGNFDSDWFLDGRCKAPKEPYQIPGDARPTITPMDVPSPSSTSVNPAPTIIVNTAGQGAVLLEADVAPSDTANRILARCEGVWDANKADCNAFAKAVTSDFQVTLNGQANDIVAQVQTEAGWTRLANGLAAKVAADEGKLVVGGLKGSDMTPAETHGHVVVVVSGPVAHGKYPSAYWGKLNSVGRKNTTVNYAWKEADRDKVIYAARTV
jgi:hypothetical protein